MFVTFQSLRKKKNCGRSCLIVCSFKLWDDTPVPTPLFPQKPLSTTSHLTNSETSPVRPLRQCTENKVVKTHNLKIQTVGLPPHRKLNKKTLILTLTLKKYKQPLKTNDIGNLAVITSKKKFPQNRMLREFTEVTPSSLIISRLP